MKDKFLQKGLLLIAGGRPFLLGHRLLNQQHFLKSEIGSREYFGSASRVLSSLAFVYPITSDFRFPTSDFEKLLHPYTFPTLTLKNLTSA